MTDHVRVLRKRLERMERRELAKGDRPPNQRDQALMRALRAAIVAMESPRAEIAEKKFSPDAGYTVQGRDIELLRDAANIGDIESDYAMGRDYIPFGGGWEVHTKGYGSSFRLVCVGPGENDIERHPILDTQLHEPLTRMSRMVRDAFIRAVAATRLDFHATPDTDERRRTLNKAITTHAHYIDEFGRTINNTPPGHHIGMTLEMAHGLFDVLLAATGRGPCDHNWKPTPDGGGLIDKCDKCGEERA